MKKYLNYKLYGKYFRFKAKYILANLQLILFVYLYKKNFSKKKLFIDCGCNKGQGFNFFKRFFPLNKYDYILLDPNPFIKNDIKTLIKNNSHGNIKFINKGISTKNSEEYFWYPQDNKKAVGGTLYPHLNNSTHNNNLKRKKVSLLKFEDFLLKYGKLYDEIILKIDVEGSEYKILDNMIKKNLFIKIKLIIIEFHSQYMKYNISQKYKKKEKIIKKILSKKKINCIEWI
ncbi:FkbM family methyltransferase [Pelagibacteraceae bacterium]|nr:FkbM family methyltransferase [Pelagibacteraceae bacterium]